MEGAGLKMRYMKSYGGIERAGIEMNVREWEPTEMGMNLPKGDISTKTG